MNFESIRDFEPWSIVNLRFRDPLYLYLCHLLAVNINFGYRLTLQNEMPFELNIELNENTDRRRIDYAVDNTVT